MTLNLPPPDLFAAPPAAPAASITPARTRPGLVLAAVVLTVSAWASAFVVIRSIGEDLDPGALALGRLLIGSVALGLVQAVSGRWVHPSAREWALITVCALAWFAAYNIALNAAEQRLDAGTSAMLVNIGPILIALGAAVILGEGFSARLAAGALVACAGAVLIGRASTGHGGRGATASGIALCLLAALAYAVGVIAQKPVLGRLPALQVTWLACLIGTLACLPWLPALAGELGDAGPGTVGGLLYLGLVPTSLAFSTWAYALARTEAGRLGVSTYVVPPLTVLLGWALLGERPAVLAVGGGFVCLLGVWVSRRPPRSVAGPERS